MPEVPSVPAKPIVSAWLYQPFESGAREGVAVTTGPVPSYWKLKLVAALEFPARSRQVPETEAFAESGPVKLVCVQESMPDVASLPANVIVRARLYQPLRSGGRDALAPVTSAAVAS